MAGDIAVHFTAEKGGWGTKRGSVSRMMRYCGELLEERVPIGVFPEGGRSRVGEEGPLLPFKLGFFDLAIKKSASATTEQDVVWLVPVVLVNTHMAWKPGDWKVASSDIYVTLGDPFPVSEENVNYCVEKLSIEGDVAPLTEQLTVRRTEALASHMQDTFSRIRKKMHSQLRVSKGTRIRPNKKIHAN